VQVRVVEVDIGRKRIALTMRTSESRGAGPRDQKPGAAPRAPGEKQERAAPKDRSQPAAMGAFGAALTEALKRR
jgi:protein Tex